MSWPEAHEAFEDGSPAERAIAVVADRHDVVDSIPSGWSKLIGSSYQYRTHRELTPQMTITEAERQTFEATVEDFHPQILEDMCLPTALKNVLDEFAARHDAGSPLSQSDLNDICDYREGNAATTHNIANRLDPEIEEYSIETRITINTSLDDLQAIIDEHERSLPLVELDAAYFESVDGYDVRGGSDGYQWNHIVIPFAVNDETVLFYDPFEQIFQRSGRIDSPPSERSKTEFYEWWSSASSRWTMWLEREDQQVLTSPRFTEDEG